MLQICKHHCQCKFVDGTYLEGILEDHPNTHLGMELAYEVHNINICVRGKFSSVGSATKMMAQLQSKLA